MLCRRARLDVDARVFNTDQLILPKNIVLIVVCFRYNEYTSLFCFEKFRDAADMIMGVAADFKNDRKNHNLQASSLVY